MDNLEKFRKAISILKAGTQYAVNDKVETEEDFNNNIKWVTGETGDNTAIVTSINPHPEITWPLLKAEMDKL